MRVAPVAGDDDIHDDRMHSVHGCIDSHSSPSRLDREIDGADGDAATERRGGRGLGWLSVDSETRRGIDSASDVGLRLVSGSGMPLS